MTINRKYSSEAKQGQPTYEGNKKSNFFKYLDITWIYKESGKVFDTASSEFDFLPPSAEEQFPKQ